MLTILNHSIYYLGQIAIAFSMFFSKINIERKCVMEEIKFESLNELFNRLYPAFNTKVCELKRSGINVSEVKLWNYLKENKWSNSKNLTLYDMVSDILNLSKSDFEGEKNDDI